jgi:hypothetical protein
MGYLVRLLCELSHHVDYCDSPPSAGLTVRDLGLLPHIGEGCALYSDI